MKLEKETYRPRKVKPLLLGLLCLFMVISGVFLTKEKPMMGWLFILLSSLGLVLFVIQLIPGSTQLTLSKEGFEATSMFRKTITRWTDVESFRIGYLGRYKTVMFDYVDEYDNYQERKNGALPTTYGMKATKLLELLNRWKNECGLRKDD